MFQTTNQYIEVVAGYYLDYEHYGTWKGWLQLGFNAEMAGLFNAYRIPFIHITNRWDSTCSYLFNDLPSGNLT